MARISMGDLTLLTMREYRILNKKADRQDVIAIPNKENLSTVYYRSGRVTFCILRFYDNERNPHDFLNSAMCSGNDNDNPTIGKIRAFSKCCDEFIDNTEQNYKFKLLPLRVPPLVDLGTAHCDWED